MKKRLLFMALILGVAVCGAQGQKYVRINEDQISTGKEEKKYYKGSVIPAGLAGLFVRIDGKPDSTELNVVGKVVKGACFPVVKDHEDLKKVRFTDAVGKERHDIRADISKLVAIKNGVYVEYDKVRLIPDDSIKQPRTVWDKLKESKYDPEDRRLYLSTTEYPIIIKGNRYNSRDTFHIIPEGIDSVEFIVARGEDYIPNVVLALGDFRPYQKISDETDKGPASWTKLMWSVIGAVSVLLFIGRWIMKKRKEKKDEEKGTQPTGNGRNEGQKEPGSIQTGQNVSDLQGQFRDLLRASLSETELSLSKLITETSDSKVDSNKLIQDQLKEIRDLVANKDQKAEVSSLKGQLQTKDNEIDRLKREVDGLNSQINILENGKNGLEEQVKSLSGALDRTKEIPGALHVDVGDKFLAFARNLQNAMVDAESRVWSYYASLDEADKSRLQYFISGFLASRPSAAISKWNGIISNLDLNGYIKDAGFNAYLRKEADPGLFVFRRFFEEFVRPYASAVVLLLEQVRTASKVGVKKECETDVNGLITAICGYCESQSISLGYCRLYSKVSDADFANLEIEPQLPSVLEKLLQDGAREKDTLLAIRHYAVNCDRCDTVEKTSCVILI